MERRWHLGKVSPEHRGERALICVDVIHRHSGDLLAMRNAL
jgi:hypothetical protein